MEKYQKQYMTITNILLSLNSTIINEVLQKYYIIKCLIKYNIEKIFDILTIYLDLKVKLYPTSKLSGIIRIYLNNKTDEDDISEILDLHLYDCSIYKYHYNSIEGFFDCNLSFTCYNSINYVYNQYNLKLDDLYYRRVNKKFCYLIHNFSNLEFYVKNKVRLANTLRQYFFNKINYATKLIKDGWIMDEFFLKDKGWSINYWNNYYTNINLIKYKNNVKLPTCCYLCGKKFNTDINDNNIVFNISDLYIHLDCIITNIYS